MNQIVKSIMSATKCDRRTAIEAIKKTRNEILAIMWILQTQNKNCEYRDNHMRLEYNPQFEEYSGDRLWGALHRDN